MSHTSLELHSKSRNERKDEGEETGRRGRRGKQLLDAFKGKQMYWNLK